MLKKRKLEIKIGDIFGDLIVIDNKSISVIEPSGRKRRSVLCKCKCGKELLVRVDGLFSNSKKQSRKSCGCTKIFVNGINAQSRRKPESVYRFLYERYKSSAKKRNIVFGLSRCDYESIIKNNCYYCGSKPELKQPKRKIGDLVGVPVPYNGIDRIDSNIGYEINNCVSCCTRCNYMKSDMDVSLFTEHILKIANHLQKL
tara:strand:- start:2370 stop:2969 length:600 start_codon:yes stop_codon:yes gene_type:complete